MAYYNYDDRYLGGRYDMGYRAAYNDRDMMYNRGGYDRSPVAFRQEPFYDSFRRDYHEGSAFGGRYGMVPMEEVARRVDAPHWMDQGRGQFQDLEYRYGRGRPQDGYRSHRFEHHGGPRDFRHGEFDHHSHDDYQRQGNHHQRTAVELYVPICCDKCERKFRKHMDYIEGVENVTVDQATKKVVVFGSVNPSHVLNRARADKAESDFWHLALHR